jgi:hypothetical protein
MTAPVALYGAGDLTSAFSQSTVTSISVNKPANLANGDLLVVVVGFQSNSVPAAPGFPAGFTRLGPAYNVTGDANRRPCGVYVKPITNLAGEGSSYAFTTTNTSGRAAIVAFRVTGADLASPAQASGAYFAPSNSATQARALTELTATAEALVLSFVWWQTNSSTALSTTWTSPATEIADIATNTGAAATHSVMSVAVDTVAAGASGTRTATLSGASTVANGSGYLVAFGTRTAATASTMRCIVHRGIVASEQSATAEESVAGLTAMMAAHPLVNGVEIDARLSTDGTPWLMHDTTFTRVFPSAPSAGSTGIENCTDAQLTSIGVTKLTDYLTAARAYHFDTIQVQHYTGATEADLTAIVAACQASGMADRIMIMTSTSTSPNTAMASLRALGWTGRIGMYGATSANWSTYSAAASTNTLHAAFAPPAAYDSNRTLAATLAAASPPVLCGASTETDILTLQHANTDGCRYALTDEPGNYAYSFVGPVNDPLPAAATSRGNFADSAFTIAPDFAI